MPVGFRDADGAAWDVNRALRMRGSLLPCARRRASAGGHRGSPTRRESGRNGILDRVGASRHLIAPTGIPSLIRRLDDLGIAVKDLHTEESSLENIIVRLVSNWQTN